MELWNELFGSMTGILSFGVILFMIGMAFFLYKWVGRNIEEDEKKHGES